MLNKFKQLIISTKNVQMVTIVGILYIFYNPIGYIYVV